MADITAEIPTVEEVIANATRMSDVSTIVNEALERHSSNSSAAAFSPFIVADVKEVNDIPEVTMTQSVYTSLHAADIPAPPVTPLPSEDMSLPESTESSIDHHSSKIDTEPVRDNTSDAAESDEDKIAADSKHSDTDAAESELDTDDDNSVHSQEEDYTPKVQPALEAQIPAEIMFLLFIVLILNAFNFLLSLTGARQCLRPT